MAIKGTKNETTAATATPANVAPDSGVPTPAPVKEKRKRGPIGPPIWVTEGRSRALAEILKNPAAATVKTARSVADALSKLPEFAGVELTPAKVALKVNAVIKERKEKGLAIPAWLKLDRMRSSATDLSLFGDDESAGEGEDREENAE